MRRPRPFPVPPKPSPARLNAATARASVHRPGPEMRAFLAALHLAEATCMEVACEAYEKADAAAGEDRAELNVAAGAATACARRLAEIVRTVAAATSESAAKRELRAHLKALAAEKPRARRAEGA